MSLAIAARLPERLVPVVRRPREDEEQVGQPVEVADALAVDLVAAVDRAPLGTAADGQLRGGRAAAGEHERPQRLHPGVDLVAGPLQPCRLLWDEPQPGALAG